MSIDIAVFLLGLFGVPVVLLIVGHRLRRRSPRARNAFVGAFIGHCVAGVLAVTLGMIPPESWTPDQTARGFAGLWSLLVLPVAGGIAGAAFNTSRFAAAAVVGAGIAGSFDPSWFRAQQAGPALVGVIGHWTAVNDGGPALKGDGAQWSGTTTRAQLESAMRPFFPSPSEQLVANGIAPGAFPLAVWNGVTNFTEGEIRVQFKMLGGKDDQNAGIVMGLQPNGEYFYVRYNTKDGDAAAWRFANGDRIRIVHGTPAPLLPLGTWHELVVRVNGTKVVGTVNGTISVEHTLAQPLQGRVGVWTKRDAVTVFRNFRVN
jgi:hypothetical protein